MRLFARRQLCLVACSALLLTILPHSSGAIEAGAERSGPALSKGFARDLKKLPPERPYGAFLHFEPGTGARVERSVVRDAGLTLVSSFERVDVVFAAGPLHRFGALTGTDELEYIEHNRRVVTYGDTAPWATRARVAQLPVDGGPYRDAAGKILDGSGVGVAIVDTGVDATHPDLAQRVVKNFKVVCSTPALVNTTTEKCFGPYQVVEDPYADATGGHGTHVAGIVAGDGTASEGTFTGVAPGASLFGFGVGEADRIFSYTEAFQYISDNLETLSPRIRVINNSWGDTSGTAFDADSVVNKLADDLTTRGVSVVWAAGNGGGNGSADRTSSFSKNPTPGAISVANYDDLNSASRAGAMSSTSSRGQNGFAATYPDISAPGSGIISTCRPVMPVCHLGFPSIPWTPNYFSLSGTSMAAPHVSGIVAMLYQARPELTPAEVEDVLLDNAFKFGSGYKSDVQNSDGTTSFDKGAGLADVPAALDALGLERDGTPQSEVHDVIADPAGDATGTGSDDLLGLSVAEEETGLRYTMSVADATDVGPATSYRLGQIVDGRLYRTAFFLTADGAEASAPSASTNNAVATDMAVDGNDISFLLPYAALGNPKPGALVHSVWMSSFEVLASDTAPGGLGIERDARPEYGTPFSIGTSDAPDPDPTVTPTPTPTPTTSPSPTPTSTPAERGTSLSFDAGNASRAQYGEVVALGASLIDDGGAPVVNQGVHFELRGLDGIRSVSGLTDPNGHAVVELTLDVPPDTYALTVSYPGQPGVYSSSESRSSLDVIRAATRASLSLRGKGANRTLDAHLVDDGSSSPLADAFVVFFGNGERIGSATTDANGDASVGLPPEMRGGKHTFEVTYDGDRYHAPASAATQS